jgi:hypothetical protein
MRLRRSKASISCLESFRDTKNTRPRIKVQLSQENLHETMKVCLRPWPVLTSLKGSQEGGLTRHRWLGGIAVISEILRRTLPKKAANPVLKH